MPRYFFDVQDGTGVFIDQLGTELPDDTTARAEASAALASMAKDQISRTAKSQNIAMWVRHENGEAIAVLTFSFALLSATTDFRVKVPNSRILRLSGH